MENKKQQIENIKQMQKEKDVVILDVVKLFV